MIALIAVAAVSPAVFTERLENGAWLVAIRIPGAHTFSAQTFLRAGSVFEPAAESGSTHLLEHLLFADGEADAIAENAGFLLNATTYREFMRLHTTGPADAWRTGMKAVARLLNKPAAASTDAEWKIIQQEDALARLDPDEAVHRSLWQSSASGSPWASLPMGNAEKKPTASIAALHGRYAVGSNVVAVIAGDLPGEEGLRALRSAYEPLPAGSPLNAPKPPIWAGGRQGSFGTRFGVGAAAPGYDAHAAYLAIEVAIEALTAPARLQPLGLEAKSFLTPSSRGSLAIISFAATDGALGLPVRAGRALEPPVSEAEFADAKARVKSRYASATPTNCALTAGLSVLFTGRVINFAAESAVVTKAQVDAAARGFVK